MALAKQDKKDIALMMGEAIEELILPRFNEIDKRFDKVEADIKEVKEDLEDVKLTVNRIETIQRSELNRVDDHELRIGKLEQVHVK